MNVNLKLNCLTAFEGLGMLHIPNHAHIPLSHVQRPGLSLVAEWTKYIPDGSIMQLKQVK
jgi:hypothetical protein